MFWLFCCAAHALVVTVILSAAHLYAVLLASLLLAYLLGWSCSPGGAQLSMTQENIKLLGYCAVALRPLPVGRGQSWWFKLLGHCAV